MIVLDASALIAHLSPDDTHHDAAGSVLLDAIDAPLLVHPLSLAEVLVGGVRIGNGAKMLADVHAIGVRLADRDDGEPMRLAELRAATRLTLPDCCVLDVAVNHRATLATFDRALATAARRLGIDVVP